MTMIGPYRLMRRLEGPGREVHLASRDGRRLVLALFDLSEEGAAELESEIERCHALEHPGVVDVVELFEHEGRQVLVFEGIAGTTLARVTEQLRGDGGGLADGAALQIGLELCRALAAAHVAKDRDGKVAPLVHAHLVPEQIFITWEGDVRILGLGLGTLFRLATGLDEEERHVQPYAPPEVQGRGVLTVRANTYSAAAILWSLLVGREPPDEGPIPALPEERTGLDPHLTSVVDRALAPMLVKRTTSCHELARAIEGTKLADPQELYWQMEALRALDTFADTTIGSESFPPSGLSEVPPSSVPSVMSWPPDSEEFQRTEVHTLSESAQATQRMSRDHMMPVIPRPPKKPDDASPKRTSTEPSMRAVTAAEAEAPRASRPRPPVQVAVEEAEAATEAATARPVAQKEEPARTGEANEAQPVATPKRPAPEPRAPDARGATALAAESVAPSRLSEPVPSSRGPTPPPVMRDGGERPPTSVRRMAVVAVASALIAAIPSFAVGMWHGEDDTEPAASERTPADCPAAESAPPPEPTQEAAHAPAPESPPPADPTPTASAATEPDASSPRPGFTALTVQTTQTDPHLYVDGEHVAPVEEGMEVPCGVHNVRIANHPLRRWYSKSKAFELPCGKTLTLQLEPWYSGPPVD